MRLMNDLVTLSREYGSDPNWVVAGGGNTSLKDGETLYIKASGYPLATIGEEGFAHMDRAKLAAIWKTDYPSGTDSAAVAERERLVLADMMAARLPGESRRPSVETLLHDILPWPLVVHLHPTLINGLTCGADGRRIASELIGDKLVWIPYTDPGYVLANVIKLALEERTEKGLGSPEYIFLENHGIFAGGRDADEVRGKYERLNKALEVRLQRRPGIMPAELTAAERTEAFGNGAAITDVARDLFGADACVFFRRRWRTGDVSCFGGSRRGPYRMPYSGSYRLFGTGSLVFGRKHVRGPRQSGTGRRNRRRQTRRSRRYARMRCLRYCLGLGIGRA